MITTACATVTSPYVVIEPILENVIKTQNFKSMI